MKNTEIYHILDILNNAKMPKGTVLFGNFIKGVFMFNIEEELKKLPNKPGVYVMRDKDNNIIYVGKAISLKNAAFSYSYFLAASSISIFNFLIILTAFPSKKSIISSICFLYSSFETLFTQGPKHLPI